MTRVGRRCVHQVGELGTVEVRRVARVLRVPGRRRHQRARAVRAVAADVVQQPGRASFVLRAASTCSTVCKDLISTVPRTIAACIYPTARPGIPASNPNRTGATSQARGPLQKAGIADDVALLNSYCVPSEMSVVRARDCEGKHDKGRR